jgi:hypothetical protein
MNKHELAAELREHLLTHSAAWGASSQEEKGAVRRWVNGLSDELVIKGYAEGLKGERLERAVGAASSAEEFLRLCREEGRPSDEGETEMETGADG